MHSRSDDTKVWILRAARRVLSPLPR